MADDRRTFGVDQSLVARVASLSTGSQRWLKTAIQAIRSSEGVPLGPPAGPQRKRRSDGAPRVVKREADLEDVITGKADLREHLETHPELAQEFEGIADVIDLLRETGQRRRRRGEEILRELLEGEEDKPQDDEETPPGG